MSANHPAAALGEIQVDAAGAIQRTPDPALVAQRLHRIAQNGQRNGAGHRYAGKSRIAFPLSATAGLSRHLTRRTGRWQEFFEPMVRQICAQASLAPVGRSDWN